jgi:hypothetical protein
MQQDHWNELEDHPQLERVSIDGGEVAKGDRVRLWPKKGGDIMDLALAGKIGIIESIEQDYESKIHFAIVVEDDPGRDLGMLRQPGHRFFFTATEIERLNEIN